MRNNLIRFLLPPAGTVAPSTSASVNANRRFFMSVTLTCAVCEKPFRVSPSHAKRRKTCSKACHRVYMSKALSGENHYAWQGGPPTASCANCGKTIKVSQKRLEEYENNFCDRECYGEWISTHQRGEKAPRWAGGSVEVTCATCGRTLE